MIINPYRFASGGAFDPDAQAFFTASGLTGATELNAVNQLVVDLKGFGIWTKMKAIYPFVGGTAALHKWNLKDPQDTNAAFRLVFNGGWTHSATGALPNGTNGYADTFFVPNTELTITDSSFGTYVAGTLTANRAHLGATESLTRNFHLQAFSTTNKNGYIGSSSVGFVLVKTGLTATTHRGFWGVSNRGATDRAMICSDASFVYSTNSHTVTPNFYKVYIGCRNQVGTAASFDAMEHRFDFIGTGLNDTELTNLKTSIEAYQTTISRQV